MKENYTIRFKKIVNNITDRPKILLHSCCAPCSSYVITLLKDFFEIIVLYYNPNIYPKEEYEKRKNEQLKLLKKLNIDYLDSEYDNDKFEKISYRLENEKEGKSRCNKCFYLRLEKTAILAKQNNLEYFGTTLTVSPYKNSQNINKTGEFLEKKYNIKYLYSDFKKQEGYKKSIELSKKYDLYRQNYCGCKHSMERK